MTELNPCRKCGAKTRISTWQHGDRRRVVCDTCNQFSDVESNEAEAIRFWNAANPVAAEPAKKLDLAKFEGCTPGEWKIIDGHYPGFIEVIGPSFKLVIITSATDLDFSDYMKRHADARLIAAAPDLLAEVKKLRERVGPGNLGQQQIDRHTKPLHAEIERLRQQVEEMRGIIDKLPKTADGVPVTPGMRLWSRVRLGYSTMSDHVVNKSEWYSTRDAAILAKHEKEAEQ